MPDRNQPNHAAADQQADDRVSRRRYQREQQARQEAEALLEKKSRELFEVHEKLSAYSVNLEQAVIERTAELRIALDRAEAASIARSRFLATMSHEIRTPLSGLLGMIDLLSMDETDPTKQELLDYAKSAGTGLSRIVNDVLDFSKMEAGIFLFEKENVDIRALIESIRILVASNAHGADRSFVVQIDNSVPWLFLGDATRIRQVISNLVSNALRYSAEGPVILRAAAREAATGLRLRIEVEDFGVGIAADKMDTLFKDFTQISNPLTAAAQGTGLGLAICKRIVTAIGGEISVESRFGKGSTFRVDIPVEVGVTPPEPEMITRGSASLSGDLGGLRVLIAEDNVVNQKLLLTYAARLGLQSDLAENGLIAYEKFAPGKYDAILTDVAMPEIDGLEFIRRIQGKWSDADLPPIIILTAHVMDAIEEEARAVRADRILSKPIPFEELKGALEYVLLKRTHPSERRPDHTAPETAPPESNAPHQPLVKPQSLPDLMGPETYAEVVDTLGLDGLLDLLEKFVTDSSQRLQRLQEAEAVGEGPEISEQAHSIKGAAMALGFAEISDLARRIELRHSQDPGAPLPEMLTQIRHHLDRLQAALATDRHSLR